MELTILSQMSPLLSSDCIVGVVLDDFVKVAVEQLHLPCRLDKGLLFLGVCRLTQKKYTF